MEETASTTATTAPVEPADKQTPPAHDGPLAPAVLHLFYDPPGTLRLTVEDRYSVGAVKLYQAAPLSAPGRYLSLLDGKSEEIVLVDRLGNLPPASRGVAEEELSRRYLTARVRAVLDVRTEFGVTYWRVATDRGERDFVVQSLSESCVWLGDGHLLIVDVDGNRFEIAELGALDPASRERVEGVL